MPQQAQTLILIALMVVAFYFLILRPQKRRQQAVQKTMRELEPGARVLLGSGVFGTIVSLGDKQAVLEISPGTQLTVLKQAIIRRATAADEDSADAGDDTLGSGYTDDTAGSGYAADDLESGYAAEAVAEPDYRRPDPLTEPEPLAPAPESSETEQDPRR